MVVSPALPERRGRVRPLLQETGGWRGERTGRGGEFGVKHPLDFLSPELLGQNFAVWMWEHTLAPLASPVSPKGRLTSVEGRSEAAVAAMFAAGPFWSLLLGFLGRARAWLRAVLPPPDGWAPPPESDSLASGIICMPQVGHSPRASALGPSISGIFSDLS